MLLSRGAWLTYHPCQSLDLRGVGGGVVRGELPGISCSFLGQTNFNSPREVLWKFWLTMCLLSRVWLFVACQVPLSLGFPRQEYWSGLPLPPPGDLPDPEVGPQSSTAPALAGRFFTTESVGKPLLIKCLRVCVCVCVYMRAQSYMTLWPMDCHPPGSSIHGISQARRQE